MSLLKKPGSLVWKILSIIVIVLILSAVTFSLQGLIRDRISYKSKVLSDIGIQWGLPKTILGPALKIPYKEPIKVVSNSGQVSYDYQTKYHYVLPDKIEIKADLKNKELYRGIYKENVFNSEIDLNGEFNLNETQIKNILNKPNFDLSKASLVFNINEIKSFKDNLLINVDNFGKIELDKAKQNPNYYELSSSRDFLKTVNDISKLNHFSMKLNVNGSRKIEFIPGAKKMNLTMKSNWPHPSFSGAYLPEDRKITDSGFEAGWHIFSIVDDYQALAKDSFHFYSDPYRAASNYSSKSSSFGVELFSPSNIYTKTERSLKYGFLFILLTFSMYFLIEVLFKQKFHEIQYLMIGLAVSIFYLLLLSLAEHIGFDISYLIAAVAVTALIGFYTLSVVDKRILAVITASLISLLYAYLYLLLQLTDYSLLFGSIGLFAVLATVMMVSRKINWYEI